MPVARLASRSLIAVSGADAASFLNGLLTQNVEALATGEVRFGALLGPQGRLLAEMFLFGDGETILVDVPADQADALIKRLSMYRLRARVELALDPRSVFTAWGDGAPDRTDDPRLEGLGRRWIGEAQADAVEGDWRLHCLSQGVHDVADLRLDADYPIECNLDLLSGIDFHKGCFVGQEIASRMKRRGKVKSRLVPITFDGPPPAFGSEILNGELRAGEMRSGLDGRAMAMLRLDRMQGDLTVEGRPARAAAPSWLPLDA